MNFEELFNQCKQHNITIVENRECKFIYNCGNINNIIELYNTLKEQKRDTTIYVDFNDGNLYYTPADPTYTDTIVSVSIF
jgi:hypothetical protein